MEQTITYTNVQQNYNSTKLLITIDFKLIDNWLRARGLDLDGEKEKVKRNYLFYKFILKCKF